MNTENFKKDRKYEKIPINTKKNTTKVKNTLEAINS